MLYRGEAFLGQQDIRPWRWLNLVFVHHRHQHLSPDLRFRRPDTAGAIGRFGFAEQPDGLAGRSEEHTSELQSLMRISYAVFCLKKKKKQKSRKHNNDRTSTYTKHNEKKI